jgi:hypothetical protein
MTESRDIYLKLKNNQPVSDNEKRQILKTVFSDEIEIDYYSLLAFGLIFEGDGINLGRLKALLRNYISELEDFNIKAVLTSICIYWNMPNEVEGEMLEIIENDHHEEFADGLIVSCSSLAVLAYRTKSSKILNTLKSKTKEYLKKDEAGKTETDRFREKIYIEAVLSAISGDFLLSSRESKKYSNIKRIEHLDFNSKIG